MLGGSLFNRFTAINSEPRCPNAVLHLGVVLLPCSGFIDYVTHMRYLSCCIFWDDKPKYLWLRSFVYLEHRTVQKLLLLTSLYDLYNGIYNALHALRCIKFFMWFDAAQPHPNIPFSRWVNPSRVYRHQNWISIPKDIKFF